MLLVSYPARMKRFVNRHALTHTRMRAHTYIGNIYTYIHTLSIYISTQPLRPNGMRHKNSFTQSLTGLNLEFSFTETGRQTKVKEFSLPYYLPLVTGRIVGFIHFSRVLTLYEM